MTPIPTGPDVRGVAVSRDPREVLDRPAPPPTRTVRYGDLPEHVADLHLPVGQAAKPLVVFIHGGFWRGAYDRVHARPLCAGLVAAGYPVASIEYRRTGMPGGGWPGTLDDVAAATRRVPELVCALATLDTVWGGAPVAAGPPILAGHSAGGHLALWAAGEPGVSARGVLALAPVASLAMSARLRLDDDAVELLLGGTPVDVPDRYARADPMARAALPCPVTLVHGALDRQVPVEVSLAYAAQTGASLIELAQTEHFGLIDPLSDAWPVVLGALADLASPPALPEPGGRHAHGG